MSQQTIESSLELPRALSDVDALVAFDVAKVGVWTKSFSTNTNSSNAILHNLLDIEETEPFDIRNIVSQCVHADDRSLVEDALDAIVNPAGTGEFDISFRVVRKNFSVCWLSMVARATFQDDCQVGMPEAITAVFRDITVRQEMDAHNRLLIDELNHRVKGTLTLVQSVAYQTFRRDVDATGSFNDFQGRLRALSKAHDLLVERRFLGTFLEPLAERVLGSCGAPFHRVSITGFPLHLGSEQAVSLSMILHELSVNALKYGAFSLPSGRVSLSWSHSLETDMVTVQWTESNGPTVLPPSQKGFGSRMIERAIALEFSGTFDLNYAPEGFKCTMIIPFNSFDQKTS
jgi:two-component sensor histidine kinase